VPGARFVADLGGEVSLSAGAISPAGNLAATAEGQTIRVWNTDTGAWVKDIQHEYGSAVALMVFSPDGKRLLTSLPGPLGPLVSIWTLEGGEPVRLQGHHRVLRAAAWSPDGSRVVTASEDKSARIWDTAMGRQIAWLPHWHIVNHAVFSPTGEFVATASQDATARVWAADTGEKAAELRHQAAVNSVEFGMGGSAVLTASADRTARVWHWNIDYEIGRMIHRGSVVAAGFGEKGVVVSASVNGEINIWQSIPEGDAWMGVSDEIRHLAWSRGGHRIAMADGEGRATAWDTTTGTIITSLSDVAPVVAVAMNHDGQYVAVAERKGVIRIKNLAGRSEVPPLKNPEPVRAMAFSADGSRLLVGGQDGKMRLWDLKSRSPLVTVDLKGLVNAVAYSHNGQMIAGGGLSGEVVLADSNGGVLARMPHEGDVLAVRFNHDGSRLASCSRDGAVNLWSTITGQRVTGVRHEAPVGDVDFSSDGARLLTASADGTARIWQVESGRELIRLKHGLRVQWATFDTQDRIAVTVVFSALKPFRSKELILRRHFLTGADLVRDACAKVMRTLTLEEWRHFVGPESYRETCSAFPALRDRAP
jgi:WD40 repeat protein